MDYESQRTRDLGCWNGYEFGTGQVKAWSQHAGRSEFVPDDDYCNAIGDLGFGKACPPELREFWTQELRKNFAGEEGRQRASMCVMNVAERDGLLGRLPFVTVPVLWLHGSEDPVFSVPNAEEEIKLFTGSPSAKLQVVEQGQHFLSGSHPKVVDQAALDFVAKFHQ
jgi:pimeloyl-ACP methyl ester carboxylesterase